MPPIVATGHVTAAADGTTTPLAGSSQQAGPSQQAAPGMPIISVARKPYLPFHMPARTTVSTTQLPQQLKAATNQLIAAPGRTTTATGGTTNSGGSSGGGIVSVDEDDESPLCAVCMEAPLSVLLAPCGHIELCQKCCESIRAADNLVRYVRPNS